MSFPHHDRFWTETADFVAARRRPGESVLAPDLFWWRIGRIARYANTVREPGARYDWAILHKGALHEIGADALAALRAEMRPVFANEVFVVWARRADVPRLADADPHLAAFFGLLAQAELENGAARSAPRPDPLVLPDPGAIAHFGAMSPRELREAMDAFYRHGGYRYETRRDRAYYAEIDRCVRALLPHGPAARILDLASGTGRLPALVPQGQCREIVATDISAVALGMARTRWAPRADCRFAAMDAARLAFADGTFDAVTLVDAAEHVLDIDRTLAEATRVLCPGGALIATAANRNSLNQVIARKLGYPEFVTNYQHVREFALDEFEALLAAHGLHVDERRGIFLFPYWGVPGLDIVVRRITDEDPEVVEILRDMGARIDPRHAYVFALRARKPG